jgi:hypothetical protein
VQLTLGRSWNQPAAAAVASLLLKARLMRELATHSTAAGALGVTVGPQEQLQLLEAARAYAERSKVLLQLLPDADRQGVQASISSALEAAYGPELEPAADVVPPVVKRLVGKGAAAAAAAAAAAGGRQQPEEDEEEMEEVETEDEELERYAGEAAETANTVSLRVCRLRQQSTCSSTAGNWIVYFAAVHTRPFARRQNNTWQAHTGIDCACGRLTCCCCTVWPHTFPIALQTPSVSCWSGSLECTQARRDNP